MLVITYDLPDIFTTCKRSLGKQCFHRCLSVHGGGGGVGFPAYITDHMTSIQGRGLHARGSASRGAREQECIPVGCVLTTAVAATRCRYSGGWADPPEGRPPTRDRPPALRQTLPPVDRQTLLKILPSLAVRNNHFCNLH